MKTPHPHIAHVLAALLCASGCQTRAQILSTADTDASDDGGATMDDSGATVGQLGNQAVHKTPTPSDSSDENPTPTSSRSECTTKPDEILAGIDELYGLAVTTNHVYVGTYQGVLQTGRDGGDSELVVDEYVQRVLADDTFLFWSTGGLDLLVQGADGESSVLLPSHGAITGVSQDADSIYAVSDGYLVRVSKETKEVQVLTGGALENTPSDSVTAVDDSFVYFINTHYSEGGTGGTSTYALERIRKEGGDPERLASDVEMEMSSATLMVDDQYVYVADHYRVARVPITGGTLETLYVNVSSTFDDIVALAQDDGSIYSVEDTTLYSIAKADGARTALLTLPEGRPVHVAKNGDDLYFDVYLGGPAFEPKSWVGRLTCRTTK